MEEHLEIKVFVNLPPRKSWIFNPKDLVSPLNQLYDHFVHLNIYPSDTKDQFDDKMDKFIKKFEDKKRNGQEVDFRDLILLVDEGRKEKFNVDKDFKGNGLTKNNHKNIKYFLTYVTPQEDANLDSIEMLKRPFIKLPDRRPINTDSSDVLNVIETSETGKELKLIISTDLSNCEKKFTTRIKKTLANVDWTWNTLLGKAREYYKIYSQRLYLTHSSNALLLEAKIWQSEFSGEVHLVIHEDRTVQFKITVGYKKFSSEIFAKDKMNELFWQLQISTEDYVLSTFPGSKEMIYVDPEKTTEENGLKEGSLAAAPRRLLQNEIIIVYLETEKPNGVTETTPFNVLPYELTCSYVEIGNYEVQNNTTFKTCQEMFTLNTRWDNFKALIEGQNSWIIKKVLS